MKQSNTPTQTLLGGLSESQFMRRHWQKKPLLVRQAVPETVSWLGRADLFALAAQSGVEARMLRQKGGQWRMRHGPFGPRSLPPLKERQWTLLVQGLDLHLDAARALLNRFRFLPDARLDDLMVSWASEGGGVGPHFDSYDVFLLQLNGRREWRIGRQKDLSLKPNLPLKVLQHFVPEEVHVLAPGDMLYLPPRWAHDGIALDGDCMTCSIGFRAPQRGGLASELVQRMADAHEDAVLYRDPAQTSTEHPAAMPDGLLAFAQDGVRRLLTDQDSLACALGEVLSEPKPQVCFEPPKQPWRRAALVLDRRSRMLYDAQRIYINGESYLAGGSDAHLMRRLADQRRLEAAEMARASRAAQALLQDWFEAGWLGLAPRG